MLVLFPTRKYEHEEIFLKVSNIYIVGVVPSSFKKLFRYPREQNCMLAQDYYRVSMASVAILQRSNSAFRVTCFILSVTNYLKTNISCNTPLNCKVLRFHFRFTYSGFDTKTVLFYVVFRRVHNPAVSLLNQLSRSICTHKKLESHWIFIKSATGIF